VTTPISANSPEAIQYMSMMREKIRRGEKMTLDECREIIRIKRADRAGVTQPKAGSKVKAAKSVVNSDQLLDDFLGGQ